MLASHHPMKFPVAKGVSSDALSNVNFLFRTNFLCVPSYKAGTYIYLQQETDFKAQTKRRRILWR